VRCRAASSSLPVCVQRWSRDACCRYARTVPSRGSHAHAAFQIAAFAARRGTRHGYFKGAHAIPRYSLRDIAARSQRSPDTAQPALPAAICCCRLLPRHARPSHFARYAFSPARSAAIFREMSRCTSIIAARPPRHAATTPSHSHATAAHENCAMTMREESTRSDAWRAERRAEVRRRHPGAMRAHVIA